MSIEALCILDFYLLYPPLLHRASMPEAVRARFRELRIPKDEDQFVQLPSAKSLFRDIAVFQRAALSSLAAKQILDPTNYLSGTARLVVSNIPAGLYQHLMASNEADKSFISFLVNTFGAIDLVGSRGLRALTGLVRRQ